MIPNEYLKQIMKHVNDERNAEARRDFTILNPLDTSEVVESLPAISRLTLNSIAKTTLAAAPVVEVGGFNKILGRIVDYVQRAFR